MRFKLSIQDKTLEGIRSKIEKCGYDKSQPVVLINGQNILVDGYTREILQKKLEGVYREFLPVDKWPTVGKIKDIYMSSVRAGFTRYLHRYMPLYRHIPTCAKYRVYPALSAIYHRVNPVLTTQQA
ncbi:MAG: hypothetical protein FWC64_12730 [Treponema sp.]|nr:hypothetical protein [Treponema sp.]